MKRFISSDWVQGFFLYVLGIVAIAGVIYALVIGLRLIPPTSLTIAAGSPGSAYYETAKKYEAILAEDGITLRIVETAGSAENRDRLDNADSGVDIALIQGGIESKNPSVQGLAAVFPEPLLIFARKEANLTGDPFTWRQARVALGADGSGTQAVAKQLARITGASNLIQGQGALAMSSADAAKALMSGELDLAFFVAPLDAPYIQPLFDARDIVLLPLAHPRAIAGQLPDATLSVLPSGAIRYHPAYPETEITLVTLVTKLAARGDLHPALVNRLVHAIVRVHDRRGPLDLSAEFPNTTLLDMPVDVYSAKLLREGFSALEKVLPYWVAAQVNRFAILLLPILFLLLPLARIVPALLAWRMQSKVYRYYDRLHEIDLKLSQEAGVPLDPETRASLAHELDGIEAGLRAETLPSKYRERAYIASEHVGLVRKKLKESATLRRVAP